MSKWFQYNQTLGKVELDETELLLIKEFRDLLDSNRNKSKTDPKGEHKERAFKELSYIYLAIDWNSPYHNYDEQDRHEAAIDDSGLTENEFNDSEYVPILQFLSIPLVQQPPFLHSLEIL